MSSSSRPEAMAAPQVFDPSDPAFIADPYPTLAALREAAPVIYDERLDRWLVTRHEDVRASLRDRRLGRTSGTSAATREFKAEPLDPHWQPFWDSRTVEPSLRRAAGAHTHPQARRRRLHAARGRVDARAVRALARGLLDPA